MKRTIYPPSDHKKTCRLCGTRTGILLDSFKHGLVNKIYSLLHITISRSDCLPNLVCHRCAGKVNEFHNFSKSCLKYDSELRKKYNVADPSPEIISSFDVRLTSVPDPDIQIIEAYNRGLGNKQGVWQSVATPNREMEQTDIQVAETRKRKKQPNANTETQVVVEGAVAVSDEPVRKDMKLVRNFEQAAERNIIRFAQKAHEPTTNETMADKTIESAKRQTAAAHGNLPATVEKPLTNILQNSTLEISQKETSLHLNGPQMALNSLTIPEGTTVTEFQKKLLEITEGKRPLNFTGARLGIRSGPKMEVKNPVASPRFAVRSSGSHTFSKSTKEKKESHVNILPSSSLNASSSPATMLKQTATRVTTSSISEPPGLGRNIIKTAIPGECDIFTCEFCEKTFLTHTAAKSHDCEGNESNGESTEGDEDELENDNDDNETDDDDGNEIDNDDSDEEGEVYLCNVCNAKYSTFEALIEHSTLHDNEGQE